MKLIAEFWDRIIGREILDAAANGQTIAGGIDGGLIARIWNEKAYKTIKHALIFTAGGLVAEICYTGIKNPPTFQGHTQLWVIPLYAFGSVFVFEPLCKRIADKPIYARVSAYAAMFFALEYVGGWATEQIIEECPWKYTSPYSINGYINLAFFPLWGGLGLLAEKVHNSLEE